MDPRKEHLELVAASLTQTYYSVREGDNPEHRDIIETYLFFLEALEDHDHQKPGEIPLQSGDNLAPDMPGSPDRL